MPARPVTEEVVGGKLECFSACFCKWPILVLYCFDRGLRLQDTQHVTNSSSCKNEY